MQNIEFLIGWEFEFGWLPKLLCEEGSAKTKKIKKYEYFNECVFDDVKKSLINYFGENFKFILEIKEDATLKFSDKYYNSYYGVEVITEPLNECLAIDFCNKFLNWIAQEKFATTNHTCGLHMNISSNDLNINNKIDYLSILKNTPQKEILKMFKRTNNTYCANSKKFSIQVECCISKERTFDYWFKKVVNAKNNTLSFFATQITSNCYNNKKKDKIKKKLIASNYNNLIEIIHNSYKERLKAAGKNLAIVEKYNPAGKRYFEYRMIGNKGYEYKFEQIKYSTNLCKKGFLESING